MAKREKTFAESLIAAIKDQDTHLATDGDNAGESTGWIDTGAYALNALCSGSIYRGLPKNKRAMLAGKSAVGKTFFVVSIMKNFQKENPDGVIIYYDSEAAMNVEILAERGLNTKNIILVDVHTVQQFRTHVMKVAKWYKETDVKYPMMCVLDSLGNLSTTKEMADIEAGSETKDMTKSGVIRGAFRSITVSLADVEIPLISTNHTYTDIMKYGAPEALSGGPGVNYCADHIMMLTRAQDKDTQAGPIMGNIITVKNLKSRFTREREYVKLRLRYDTGLDKYYGLLDIALRSKVVTAVSNKYTLPDGTEAKESTIYKNPEKYFTKEFLDLIDKGAGELFKYGGSIHEEIEEDDDGDSDTLILENES